MWAFLAELGRASVEPTTAYLVGGASAVLNGWRRTTIDVDLYLEPERDELLRTIPGLKERLQINIELASPLDFLPPLPGWRDRSRYVSQEGKLTVRDFDFYAQALAKLERGFAQDLRDVSAMIARGLVSPPELERLFNVISDQLYRFPAVDGAALRSELTRLAR
ncbi:MAG: DUF6036 family nucleotidyltransferase [Chloroflexota bacterium]